jgi:regulator of protease activity HflC (stomatin/prohibitin superfamily)
MGPALRGSAGLLLVGGGCGMLAYNSVYVVDPGFRSVVFNRLEGVKQVVFQPGMNFVVPWFEWPTIYDVRTKPKKISSSTGTRDLQTINISLRVLYKPRADSLPTLHQRFGPEYDECILPSILNETLKSVIVSPAC